VNAAKKVAASGNAQGQVDVDGYRGKVADAVGIEVGDLVAQGRDNPRAAMLRMIAAYFLLQQDRLSVGDIARIMDTTESWVRSSTSYIARRVNSYTAFRIYIEQTIGAYALVSPRAPGEPASGTDGIRERIAGVVGVSVAELVAFERDNDAEIVQRVAAYLLLSKDGLPVAEVAQVMAKGEAWVRSSRQYVESHIRRDAGLRSYVEKTAEAYVRA